MPASPSYDATMDEFPSYVKAGYHLDRSWMEESLCRSGIGGEHRLAWLVSPEQKVSLGGGSFIKGERLIASALSVCIGCPVQWDCADYAVRSMADAATWAMHIADLRWLRRQGDWGAIIEVCREDGVAVQVGVSRLREIRTVLASQVPSSHVTDMDPVHSAG